MCRQVHRSTSKCYIQLPSNRQVLVHYVQIYYELGLQCLYRLKHLHLGIDLMSNGHRSSIYLKAQVRPQYSIILDLQLQCRSDLLLEPHTGRHNGLQVGLHFRLPLHPVLRVQLHCRSRLNLNCRTPTHRGHTSGHPYMEGHIYMATTTPRVPAGFQRMHLRPF